LLAAAHRAVLTELIFGQIDFTAASDIFVSVGALGHGARALGLQKNMTPGTMRSGISGHPGDVGKDLALVGGDTWWATWVLGSVGGIMSFSVEKEIEWNGRELSITVRTDTGSVLCTIPRDTIHAIPIYNDAVGWEIERNKADIFERFKSALSNKINLGANRHMEQRICLSLSDVIQAH
jgi:hypothetical protein